MSWLTQHLGAKGPGLLVSAVVAIAAKSISDHYGAPAMLMALLLGIAFSFLSEEGRCTSGIQFTVSHVLRFGVALLGARISLDLLLELGPELIGLTILGVVCTILFAFAGAKLLGRGWRLALLTGGSVAICGASAAIAISAVLPKNEHSERNLTFTILSVTVLSTAAMVIYPVIAEFLGLDPLATGVFLGGTIHDVAQVVGAGFSISEETGEASTLVKLIRVSMLAPVVLIISVAIRARGPIDGTVGRRPPLIPGFVIAFLLLAFLSSLGVFPEQFIELLNEISRWALLVAIAAVGMKTSLRRVVDVGGQAIALIIAETLFIGLFVLLGIFYLA